MVTILDNVAMLTVELESKNFERLLQLNIKLIKY